MKNQLQTPIIFFDGLCGMCNNFVNHILRVDREQTFTFAPLQGSTARDLLPPLTNDARQWSLIYLDESGIHDQSDAFVQIYRRIGGVWWPLSWLRLVPRPIRNSVYRHIARNRLRWFGKRESCRLPTPEERARFLP